MPLITIAVLICSSLRVKGTESVPAGRTARTERPLSGSSGTARCRRLHAAVDPLADNAERRFAVQAEGRRQVGYGAVHVAPPPGAQPAQEAEVAISRAVGARRHVVHPAAEHPEYKPKKALPQAP